MSTPGKASKREQVPVPSGKCQPLPTLSLSSPADASLGPFHNQPHMLRLRQSLSPLGSIYSNDFQLDGDNTYHTHNTLTSVFSLGL